MKNRLVVIGYLGSNQCYLNVPKEEAQRRYMSTNGYIPENWTVEDMTEEFEFEDEFWAYEAKAEG